MYRQLASFALATCAASAMAVSGDTTAAPHRGTARVTASPTGAVRPEPLASSAGPASHDLARYGQLPLSFEPNEGQHPPDVAFLAHGRGYELGLSASGAALTLQPRSVASDGAGAPEFPDVTAATTLKMTLVGARRGAPGVGVNRLPGYANYLIGKDASRWRTHIPTYGAVRFDDVYTGIDVVYYAKGEELEYDFLVEPGADPSAIALRFEGVRSVSLSAEGDLVLLTEAGEVRQHKPVIYQEAAGGRQPVAGHYELRDGAVRIAVGDYDATVALIIDPVLIYSGYTGGDKRGEGIAVDASGHAYVAGWTSVDGPKGHRDAFVMKINPAGTQVVYSTYIGGYEDDFALDVAIDNAGGVYLTGYTKSHDFPMLQAFDLTKGPGLGPEPFVTRLAPDGATLVYSSYLGADTTGQDERGTAIAVHNGNAYVVGYTDQPGFPTTPDAFQKIKPGPSGTFQAFLAKVGPTGALLYSTYLGGTNGHDYAYDVAVDGSGAAYVAGRTNSRDFPTLNPIQTWKFPSSRHWGFVTKLSAAGTLVYSTYLGGDTGHRASVHDTEAHGIAVDASGSAYVTGSTQAINFPTTAGAYDRTCTKQPAAFDCFDIFVSKLNASGTGLVYSTYLGGSQSTTEFERGHAIAVDAAGRAYVTGTTDVTDFPVLHAFKSAVTPSDVQGGEAFVAVLDAAGAALVYSSYLGGTADGNDAGGFDEAYDIALDTAGNAYATGATKSIDFPVIGGFSGPPPCVVCYDEDGVQKPPQTGGFVAKISAAGCTYAVTPTAASAPASGGSVTVNVVTGAGCGWGASSTDSWLAPVPTGGTGSRSVSVTVSRNSTVTPRSGRVTIAGTAVTLTQPGGTPTAVNCTDDTDCDGLPTAWELQFGLDPSSQDGAAGAGGDPDNDGRTNAQEFAAGTHPRGFHTRYFAEGATGSFFDVRLALFNPNASGARTLLRFLTGTGSVVSHVTSVAANTRTTLVLEQIAGLSAAEFSTVIESDVPLVADRTMSWDSSGYGSHSETSLPAAASTWYLAEGATHSGFSLFYLIQNPNSTATTVQVTYLLPAPAAPIVKSYPVAANSRFNIWVNHEGGALSSTDVSAVITAPAGTPIIVERAMYRDSRGQMFGAGHNSAGITTPSSNWFLAEGATGSYFDLFVLVANPNAADAQVTATYLLPSGQTLRKTYTVGAKSRFNIWVDLEDAALADTAVSTTLVSSVPVIVERAMWWPFGPANWFEAHNSAGATVTGTRWALAEGEVGGPRNTDTYVLIANTSTTPGSALVTLRFEDGTSATKTFPLPASSRVNVDVRSEFPQQAVNKRFAVTVESVGNNPAQIVVERAMYSDANGVPWAAGTNALATRLQ